MNQRILSLLIIVSFVTVSVCGQRPRPTPPTAPIPTTPQQPGPEVDSQDVVKITTNLVQIDAVVNKNGKPVTDLQAEDFEVFEDGKPQVITNFSYIANVPDPGVSKTDKPQPRASTKDKTPVPVLPARINPGEQRRVMALVVDDLGMSFESLGRVKKQIKGLFEGLGPNDLVAVIRTGGDIGALQQFTNDRRLLEHSADRLQWNQCSRVGLEAFAPAGEDGSNISLCAKPAEHTLKALRFILRGMSYLPGRKSMVLFSDYLPIERQEVTDVIRAANQQRISNDSLDTPALEYAGNYYAALERLAEIAIRASVVIYGVDTRGLVPTGLKAADQLAAPNFTRPNMRGIQTQIGVIENQRKRFLIAGREGSELIAKETGGFLIKDQNNLGLDQIMADQHGYYLIGFRPSEETFNKKFHHLKVKARRGGLSVRTRQGFYGFTDTQVDPAPLSASDQMNRALVSPFAANELTVRLSTLFVDDAAAGPLLRSFLHLDARDLTFTDQAEGWHVANIDLRGMLFGENGRIVDQKQQTGTLRFRGEEYERVRREGIVYGFDLPVRERGALQFRVAVRDVSSSHLGAAGQFVDVPDLKKGTLALSGIFARGINQETNVAPATQAAVTSTGDTVAAGPGIRRFRLGSAIVFGYAIYNASFDRGATLSTQMRVFRDGKLVYAFDPRPVSPEGASDPQRIIGASALQIGLEMAPGNYIVQIIATNSGKSKPRTASQWIDFEVFK